MRAAVVLVGMLALVLAMGSVSAQGGIENPSGPTPTTLYFHLGAATHFPINTQVPDASFETTEVAGLSRISTSCIPDPTGNLGLLSHSFHTEYGFSTPGYVQYEFSERGQPRIHPERGLAAEVLLDDSTPMVLYWYLETQVLGDSDTTPEGLENLPVVVPQVTVRATMREGDDVSVGAVAYNAGTVIAIGTSEPMILWPDPSNPHYHTLESGKHLYEFVVPMSLEAHRIPEETSYNLRIDVFMSVPGCDSDPEASLMTSSVRAHTSAAFRPRVDLSILNPLWIDYVHPQVVGDMLVIHSGMNSPWGNYDINGTREGIQVRVSGPSEAKSLTRTAFVQRHHEHNHHFVPVEVAYSWPFVSDGAKEGLYTIEVRAMNLQGTASAVGRASFEIGRNIGIDSAGNVIEAEGAPVVQGSPALPLASLLAVLAFALLLQRRR